MKGELKIKLESLKTRCEITDKFNINLISKRRTVDFKISVGIRTPLHEKEYTTILHPKISISKIYSEFQLPQIQNFDEEEDESRMSTIHHNNDPNNNLNRNPIQHKESTKPNNDNSNSKNTYNNGTDFISKKSQGGEENNIDESNKEVKKVKEENNSNNDKGNLFFAFKY